MATFAARKLGDMAENTANILAIELLAAAQGVDMHAPHRTSPSLAAVMHEIRQRVPHYDLDRYFAPDIATICEQVTAATFAKLAPMHFASQS